MRLGADVGPAAEKFPERLKEYFSAGE